MSRFFSRASGSSTIQNDQASQLPSTSLLKDSRDQPNTHWLVLAPWHSDERGLKFDPIFKECIEGKTHIILTRGTDPGANDTGDSQTLVVPFASRVVSRNHSEIWCEPGGIFYIRDTSSTSGTFLNTQRLGTAGQHFAVFRLNDGDMLQLGTGTHRNSDKDVKYRAVSMRVIISPGRKGVESERLEDTSANSKTKRPLSANYALAPSGSPISAHVENGPQSSRTSQWYGSPMGQIPGVGAIGVSLYNGPGSGLSDAAAPPRYRTPSPEFEQTMVQVEDPLSRYAAQNRHEISLELESKLRKAHYMPEDNPDEISSEEWQRSFGVGYFELKRLRQLYSRNFAGNNEQ